MGSRTPAWVRRTSIVATLAVTPFAVAGCGGDDGEPSAEQYYGSIDRFCTDVARAAKQVGQDTTALRRDKGATRRQLVRAVSGSLQEFADATEAALATLQTADVPSSYAGYQRATTAGFRRFVTTLRATADAADKGSADALARLGPRLQRIKLPATPPAITAHAKACAGFTPTPG